MNIKTNNVPRDIIYGFELSQNERKEFDYYSDEEIQESTFFRYRGEIYDIGEFTCIAPRSRAYGFVHGVDSDSPLLKWDGIMTDSYFSGIVIKHVDNFERVIVGLATT